MHLDEPEAYPREGCGNANSHHGEILQGMYVDAEGRLHRALISLICDARGSQAKYHPSGDNILNVNPVWKVKARRAAELTLDHLNIRHRGGLLTIKSNIPVGWGLGSSTSDVTAAIRAVADAFGERLPSRCIAQLAVKAEVASDPLMFGDRAVLFAHREGNVIEDFGECLPPLEVVGFNTDPNGNGIDTVTYRPARYDWWDIEAFRAMIGLMRKAVQVQASHLVGRVASASARINQRHLPKPYFDRLERLADDVGAVGIQVAHSGTVAGFLFDPRDANTQQQIECSQALLAEMGFGLTCRFRTKGS
ncbi:MAG TPA: hypothetical protein VNI02_22850 [Blastocatellia bacterium]|nr:hypothetical protein [Blastocatellia bacterium]